MAIRTGISVEEYLRMAFDGPDREYVDGEVIERNMGNPAHARIQMILSGLLLEAARRNGWFGYSELRIRLAVDRYRIPDLCVYFSREQTGDVAMETPDLALEILSPDDRFSEVHRKLDEYLRAGVKHIWVVDPVRKTLSVYDRAGMRDVERLEIPGALQILASQLFQ